MVKKLELTGQKFGRLLVVGYHGLDKHNKRLWDCRCDCGKSTVVTGNSLTHKTRPSRSCGCLRVEAGNRRKGIKQKRKDYTGIRSGRLVAVSFHSDGKQGQMWNCKCDCGKDVVLKAASLTLAKNPTRSCGCLVADRIRDVHRGRTDLTGRRFGRITVIDFAGNSKHGKPRWNCRCDCGKSCVITGSRLTLTDMPTRSCGCLRDESIASRSIRHGETVNRDASTEYRTWNGIKNRCYDAKSRYYANYGGRGIKMCDRWLESFDNFLADMGRRPPDKSSIDRIDNDGDYCPENCRWATFKEQMNNQRKTVIISAFGETKTLNEWAITSGLQPKTIQARLRLGWTPEESLSLSISRGRKIKARRTKAD